MKRQGKLRDGMAGALLAGALVVQVRCSSFRGSDGGTDDGAVDGAGGSDGVSPDGGGVVDPIPCTDGGCGSGGASYCVNGTAQTFQSRCCSGTSTCPRAHLDGTRTIYDCAMNGTCSEAEARCFCDAEMKSVGGSFCEDLNAGGDKAICHHAALACFCWGYAGASKCKTAGYTQQSGSCDTMPASTGWN